MGIAVGAAVGLDVGDSVGADVGGDVAAAVGTGDREELIAPIQRTQSVDGEEDLPITSTYAVSAVA